MSFPSIAYGALAVLLMTATPEVAATPPGRAQEIAAVQPSITEAEAAAFGEVIARAFNEGKSESVLSTFDSAELFERVLQGIDENDRPQFGSVRSSCDTLRAQVGFTFSKIKSARFLRVETVDGESRVLVRLVSGDGALSYYAFVVAQREKGRPRWIDAFVYLSGELMSDSIRWMALPVLVPKDEGLWARLVGGGNDFAKAWPDVMAAEDRLADGKGGEAMRIVDRLPAPVRTTRPIFGLRLRIARELGVEAQLAVLADWARCFPSDPTPELVGIDTDLQSKNYAGALLRLEVLKKLIGGDPYIDFIRANLLRLVGRLPEARTAAREALGQESTLVSAYDILLQVELEAKDYQALASVIDEIEGAVPGFDFLAAAGKNESYSGFRASAEYEQWLGRRAARKTAAEPAHLGEEECAAFGARIAAAVNAGQVDSVITWFDPEALCNRAVRGFRMPEQLFRDFRAGFVAAGRARSVVDFTNVAAARYLRTQTVEGDRRVLLRLLGANEAANYLALVCARRSDGSIGWVDVFNYASGESVSTAMRRDALPALVAHEAGLRTQISGSDNLFLRSFSEIDKAGRLISSGKNVEALKVLRGLPEEMRDDRMILSMMVGAAARIGEEEYLSAVDDWAFRRPGDPGLALAAISASIRRKQYLEAARLIDSFSEAIGGDPYLDYRKASVLLLNDDLNAARDAANQAIGQEPELKPAYQVLWRIELAARDYPAVGRALDAYETRFPDDDQVSAIMEDRAFERFCYSSEYSKWLKRRAERKPSAKP